MPPSDFHRAVKWGCGLYIGWFLASCCVLFSLWLLFFGGCVVLFGTGAAILSTQSHDTSLPPPPLDRPRIPEPPAPPPVPPPHRPAHYVRSDLADGLRITHVVRAIEPPEADDAERRRLARAIADAERLDAATIHFFRARDAVDEWNGDAEVRPHDALRLRATVEVRGNQVVTITDATPADPQAARVPPPQASPEPPPTPSGPTPQREAAAASKLRLAKKLRSEGQTITGNRWLREVVDQFPETDAAAESRRLLGLPARRISN